MISRYSSLLNMLKFMFKSTVFDVKSQNSDNSDPFLTMI